MNESPFVVGQFPSGRIDIDDTNRPLEGYQKRLVKEYRQLTKRMKKLRTVLVRISAARSMEKDDSEYLDFELNVPSEMLVEQYDAMVKYHEILEMRMVIMGVPIPE